MDNKIYLQITSGRGLTECCRVVALVLEQILNQAKGMKLDTEILERELGEFNRTLYSATISIEGQGVGVLLNEWEGTIQWISKSPYRIHHQRKNWFIAVKCFQPADCKIFDEKDIFYQTIRASGPGGQHVNKTESAVRAIHRLSGLSVTASDQRSQLQNKKLATERLMIKLATWSIEQIMNKVRENWNNHNQLERGNPVKTIQKPLAK